MSRTHRALAVLALSVALATGTTAVAVAAPPTPSAPSATKVQAAAQLTQRKALYESELQQNLATAAQPVAEDQSDRLLRGIEAATASRDQAAVERVRAGERNLDPAPVVTIAPQPVPAASGRDVDPLAILLLGLVGGLAGGAAAAAGWSASHRRPRGAVAA
jgi:ABC-type phosphate/phosphonate transport system substrate-binding protein